MSGGSSVFGGSSSGGGSVWSGMITETTSSSSNVSNSYQRELHQLSESSNTFIMQYPIKQNSEIVSLNGVTLHPSGEYIDYQVSSDILTINFIPDVGDVLLVSYVVE